MNLWSLWFAIGFRQLVVVMGMYFVLMLFNLVLIIVKPHSVTNFESKGQLIAGILSYWLIITFYRKYFFAVLEVRLEVFMLTATKEVIDAAMMYGREKVALAMLKPEQDTAISIFALGKDKITGSRCFLNHNEETDDLSSQGSLLQMKQGCRAIDRSNHATTNARNKRTVTLWRQFFCFIKLNRNDITNK